MGIYNNLDLTNLDRSRALFLLTIMGVNKSSLTGWLGVVKRASTGEAASLASVSNNGHAYQ